MNRSEFLNTLKKSLGALSAEERDDIIADYGEHFDVGLERGRSEEQIAAQLGSPETIAKAFVASYRVKKVTQTEPGFHPIKKISDLGRAILAILALGFFNLVFVLGPFLSAVFILLLCCIVVVAEFIAAFAITFVALFGNSITFDFMQLAPLTLSSRMPLFFYGCAAMGFGVLCALGVYSLLRGLSVVTMKYIKANLNLINPTN